MYKTISVLLIVVGLLLGPLFLLHLFSLTTNIAGWVSSGDWLSFGKRILTTFIVGALAYKSFTVGRRRLKEGTAGTQAT